MAGARSYAVRVESPFGPFFLFTDSTAIRLTGDLRNIFAGDLQRVFIPGFRQDIDRRGGGLELLRLLPHEQRSIHGLGDHQSHQRRARNVRIDREPEHRHAHGHADQTEPIEGRFRLTPTTNDQNTPTVFSLYVESKGARDDLPSSLTGRYTLGASTTRGDGIIGKFSGTAVSLALLANQLSGDTVDVFLGELEGDTIRGTYTRRSAS